MNVTACVRIEIGEKLVFQFKPNEIGVEKTVISSDGDDCEVVVNGPESTYTWIYTYGFYEDNICKDYRSFITVYVPDRTDK